MCIAEKVVLTNEYVTEISRMACTTLAKLSNDPVVCFDNQVNFHAMLNIIKYEVQDQVYKLLSVTLHQTNYYIKTVLDITDISYYVTPEYPLYRIGQRSGCARKYSCSKALP